MSRAAYGTCDICDCRTIREAALCYVHEPWQHASPGARALVRDAVYVQKVADERARRLEKAAVQALEERPRLLVLTEEWSARAES